MADVKRKVLLQFDTDLQQAKQDVTKLGELYEQSTNPTAQQGALSAEQKGALESEIGTRAADLGQSPEQVKKTLEDINKLKQEARSLDQQNAELDEKNIALAEKSKKAKDDENAAIKRAGELLGLKGDFTKKDVDAARETLRTSKDLAMSDKERSTLLKQVNREYDTARGAVRRQNNALADQQKNITIINENTNKQGKLVDDIRGKYLKLTRTTDERDTVEGKVTEEIVKQRLELGKNEKAAKNIATATENNAKAHAEYTRQIKQTPDTFGGKITSAFLYYQALSAVRRVAREAVRTITELDKALTDIAVVTSMTRQQTWNLLGTYQTMAKEVGLTTTQVANLSIAFFRQGRSAVDALRLTESAAKFARIAALDVNEAANFLTAAINGFNLSASDANTIIDKFAALGASAAASASEIAIALSKVAPAAASAGVEVDTLMAFITKGIETTREAPENIGTAFKTVFARMRQLTDIGTTIEDGVSVNRVEDSLKSIGVELRDANGEFRDLDDVLIEVGGKWDSITRNQQAYVATTLAGTRQQTRLIALFEDFDRTLELIEVSQNAAGTAAIQHTEFMGGLEVASTRLKTSFQQLITSFVNSDAVISFLTLINDGVELLNTGVGRLIVSAGLLGLSFQVLAAKGYTLAALKSKLFLQTVALGNAQVKQLILDKKQLVVDKLKAAMGIKQIAINTKNFLFAKKDALVKVFQSLVTKKLTLSTIALTAATWAYNIAAAVNPLVWVGLAIAAIIGLAVAFKRIRESNDTTNLGIAKMKIVFDRWAAGFKALFDGIVSALSGLIDAIKNFLENPFVKNFIRVSMFIGTFGMSEVVRFAIQTDEVEDAAAEFRVATNRIKEMNQEINILQRNTGQLNKALKDFQDLDRIAFKTPAEIKNWTESQNVLKDSIISTLETMLEADQISETEFATEMAQVQFNNTAASLENQAQRLSQKFDGQIEQLQQDQSDIIYDFMDNFDGTWAEAIENAAFADLVGNLPMFAAQIAIDQIDAANEALRAAFNRGAITADQLQAGLLEGSGRDAALRAITLNPAAFLDGLSVAKEATEDFYFNTLPSLEGALEKAFTGSSEDFEQAILDIRNIDLSGLTIEQQNLIDLLFPNLDTLGELAATSLAGIAKAGGIAYIREFQSIADTISNINFLPVVNAADNVEIQSAAEQADALTDYLFNQLAVGAEDRAGVITELLSQIYSGVIAGVVLDPTTQQTLAASVINAAGSVDFDKMERSVSNFRSDMDSIEAIMTKPITQLNEKDIDLLEQYPDIYDDLLAGSLDLNKYREEGTQNLLDELDAAQTLLNIEASNLAQQLELGLIRQDQYDEGIRIVETQSNSLELLRQQVTANKINVESLKEQYKLAINSINAQKKAISDAKAMRDLQKESAEIASKTIAASRVGAVGTIEASFNRQQLNQEIAEANKILEDSIVMAQLEAQQQILEDSQQRAIEQATKENTIATRQSTLSTDLLRGSIEDLITSNSMNNNGINSPPNNTPTVNTPTVRNSGIFGDPYDYENRQLAVQPGI